MTSLDSINELKSRMSQSIIGQQMVVERLILALLANGNVLMEGLPGLAKTRAIKSMAKNLESDFSRIQFTPDLLPSDVTGTEIYYDEGGKGRFVFQKGPIFGNLILADEINRAPAKVQAALLEAMEERQVTVAGKTYKLPELFMVLANQNPVEQEGTYPLPEAQMDRFLMHITIDYPNDESEAEIIRLVREESGGSNGERSESIPQGAVFAARAEIHQVALAEPMERYLVSLIAATRRPAEFNEELGNWILVGASPRGSIALDKVSRAHAWLQGRDHVTPDDIRAVLHDCLRHRLMLTYEANAAGISADAVIDELIKQVAVA
ncbi:MAG: MoxR family ATPase [Desulfobacteraceae bacterium]|nr:MoxR family ATPase [Desulfobacteraceae bacterium]